VDARRANTDASAKMKIVQQTIASLGSPTWIEPLERPDGSAVVIAQWRHLNGRLLISTADAIRVCLSLNKGQSVSLRLSFHSARRHSTHRQLDAAQRLQVPRPRAFLPVSSG
jgi:hypothetical protein